MRTLTLIAHALLIAGLAWTVGSSVGAVLVVPLLLPLQGLWVGRRYTYAWTTMLITFYCAGFAAEAYMRPAEAWWWRGLAAIAAIEFVSLNLFVRRQAAAARAAAAAAPPAGRMEG
jgi:uncharacterized membrane protein